MTARDIDEKDKRDALRGDLKRDREREVRMDRAKKVKTGLCRLFCVAHRLLSAISHSKLFFSLFFFFPFSLFPFSESSRCFSLPSPFLQSFVLT